MYYCVSSVACSDWMELYEHTMIYKKLSHYIFRTITTTIALLQSIYLSICLSVCLSIYRSIDLSILSCPVLSRLVLSCPVLSYLSIYLSIYVCVCAITWLIWVTWDTRVRLVTRDRCYWSDGWSEWSAPSGAEEIIVLDHNIHGLIQNLTKIP